jgi:hypothetical protein
MASFFSSLEEDAVLSCATDVIIVPSATPHSERLGGEGDKYWIIHPSRPRISLGLLLLFMEISSI